MQEDVLSRWALQEQEAAPAVATPEPDQPKAQAATDDPLSRWALDQPVQTGPVASPEPRVHRAPPLPIPEDYSNLERSYRELVNNPFSFVAQSAGNWTKIPGEVQRAVQGWLIRRGVDVTKNVAAAAAGQTPPSIKRAGEALVEGAVGAAGMAKGASDLLGEMSYAHAGELIQQAAPEAIHAAATIGNAIVEDPELIGNMAATMTAEQLKAWVAAFRDPVVHVDELGAWGWFDLLDFIPPAVVATAPAAWLGRLGKLRHVAKESGVPVRQVIRLARQAAEEGLGTGEDLARWAEELQGVARGSEPFSAAEAAFDNRPRAPMQGPQAPDSTAARQTFEEAISAALDAEDESMAGYRRTREQALWEQDKQAAFDAYLDGLAERYGWMAGAERPAEKAPAGALPQTTRTRQQLTGGQLDNAQPPVTATMTPEQKARAGFEGAEPPATAGMSNAERARSVNQTAAPAGPQSAIAEEAAPGARPQPPASAEAPARASEPAEPPARPEPPESVGKDPTSDLPKDAKAVLEGERQGIVERPSFRPDLEKLVEEGLLEKEDVNGTLFRYQLPKPKDEPAAPPPARGKRMTLDEEKGEVVTKPADPLEDSMPRFRAEVSRQKDLIPKGRTPQVGDSPERLAADRVEAIRRLEKLQSQLTARSLGDEPLTRMESAKLVAVNEQLEEFRALRDKDPAPKKPRAEPTAAGMQNMLDVEAPRKVPDEKISGPTKRAEDVKGGLFDAAEQAEVDARDGVQGGLLDAVDEIDDDPTSFNFGANVAPADEDLIRVEYQGVKVSKSEAAAMAAGKAQKHTKLVERGLVDPVSGRMTPKGELALTEHVRRVLTRQDKLRTADADAAMRTLAEMRGAMQMADDVAAGVIGRNADVRELSQAISPEFVERAGMSMEHLPQWFVKRHVRAKGRAAFDELEDLQGVGHAGLVDEADYIRVLMEGKSPMAQRVDEMVEAMHDLGFHGERQDLEDLAKLFVNQRAGAHGSRPMSYRRALQGLMKKPAMRKLLAKVAKARRSIEGRVDDPRRGWSDDDVKRMMMSFGLVPGAGAGRYDDALFGLQLVAEGVFDLPVVGSVLKAAINVGLNRMKIPRNLFPGVETGAQAVRTVFDPTYKLPLAYVDLIRTPFKEGVAGGDALAREFFAQLNRWSPEDQRKATRALTGLMRVSDEIRPGGPKRNVIGRAALDASGVDLGLTETQIEQLEEIQKVMVDLGRQAVGMGLLGGETFFRNYGTYLPRLYSKHVFLNLAQRAGISRDLALDMYQARYGASMGSVMDSLGHSDRVRIGWDRFKRRKDSWGVIYGPKVPKERYRRRPKGAIEKRFTNEAQYRAFVDRLDRKQIVETWEPLSEEVRQFYGEIQEAPYPVYKGVTDLNYDVRVAELFDAIAKNDQWAVPIPEDGIIPEGFRPIYAPSSGPGGVMRKFDPAGPLRNMAVRSDIADDVGFMLNLRYNTRIAGDWLTRLFKYSKVVANPATHFRNIYSNMILMNLGGMPVHQVLPAWKQAALDVVRHQRTGEADGFLREAIRAGVLDDTMFQTEMDVFAKSVARTYGADPTVGTASYLAALDGAAQKVGSVPGAVYQAEEQAAKLAMYRWAREQGMSIRESRELAFKWIFNYSEVPPFLHVVRSSPLGAPFITFQYKALPRFAELLAERPGKLLTWWAAGEALNQTAQWRFDADLDRERGLLPDYMQNLQYLPIKGAGNNRMAMEFWNFIWPFQAPELSDMIGGWGYAGIAGLLNRDPYFKQPIYNEDEPEIDQWVKLTNFGYRYLAPGWAPPMLNLPGHAIAEAGDSAARVEGGYSAERWRDWWRGVKDMNGGLKQPSLWRLVLDTGLGVRLRELDPKLYRQYALLDQLGIVRQYQQEARKVARGVASGEYTQAEAEEKLEKWGKRIEVAADRLQALNRGREDVEIDPAAAPMAWSAAHWRKAWASIRDAWRDAGLSE